ncbi:MAG: 2-(1,2-epoxy-1,2-dihydrophenyl)acetyl-CoA isomerase [Bacteroidetes bacterium]|nr:MAG: 2-(1,2-epoxy-1,2-dihydrophenyl)acetyl-CoA isomerase [Bacteroidota bacterium]
MDYQTLRYDFRDHIATITLNRPDTYNAFNEAMSREFIDVLKHCKRDPEVRVIVLAGAGRAFCSGQDLKDVAGKSRSLGESVERRYNPMIRLIRETEKPFLCRLHGVAAGAGASLALACDYVLATDQAKLVWAFVNIGLVLDSGSSWFLPRLAGHRQAFALATLGDKITAREALDMGLINEIVPADELDDDIYRLASRYAEKPPKAVGLIKRMLNRSFESSLDEMLEMEKFSQEIAGQTEDYQEGVAAFNEKRKPVFKGK